MARRERESSRSPENKRLIQISPVDLMRDNPAALIVNQQKYDIMAAGFDRAAFQEPQVARVETFSAEHGRVVKLFVVDGHTRTKFVIDNQEKLVKEHPEFIFQVQDVTDSALRNSYYMQGERTPGQDALTIVQYLRAVVPPTVAHQGIVKDRMASHLINAWENMVGNGLAEEYSAIAALSLLAHPSINITDDKALKRSLGPQQKIMVNESIDERVKLEKGLLEMATIVRETWRLSGVHRGEIARAAFELVSAESPVIGGEQAARAALFGLLRSPEVNRKLEDAFGTTAITEAMRDQLDRVLWGPFKRAGQTPGKQGLVDILAKALKDPRLTFSQVEDVYNSPDPLARCNEVQAEVNHDRLLKTYKAVHGTQALTPVEQQLIKNIGNQIELVGGLDSISRTIKTADTAYRQAEQDRDQLARSRDQLIAQGVNPDLFAEFDLSIQNVLKTLTSESVNSPSRVNGVIQSVNGVLEDMHRRVERQVSVFKIGEIVDGLTGDKLKEGYGPEARLDIINLLIGEFGNLTDRNRHVVQRRVSELTSLDLDLLSGFKRGNFTLIEALRRQRERERDAQQRAMIQVLPVQPVIEITSTPTKPVTPEQPTVDVAPVAPVCPVAPSVTPVTAPQIEASPVQPSGPEQAAGVDDVVSRTALDERRKRINREKLTNLTTAVEKALGGINLRHGELTQSEQEPLENLIRKLGRLAFGHPDLPRVYRDHEARLKQERLLLGAIAEDETEAGQRDARTGR